MQISSYSTTCTRLYSPVKNVKRAYTSALSQFRSLAKQITPPKISRPVFKRGKGFWSSPRDEAARGIFSKLTEPNSQRENWYAVAPYIAEFWCAVSNMGFLYVGALHRCPELIFAGVASVLSHSIPKQWLLTVDKIGVAVVLTKVLRNYHVLLRSPWLATPIAVAAVINLVDAHRARKKGETLPHVVWHLSAAAIAHVFLSRIAT